MAESASPSRVAKAVLGPQQWERGPLNRIQLTVKSRKKKWAYFDDRQNHLRDVVKQPMSPIEPGFDPIMVAQGRGGWGQRYTGRQVVEE